MKKTAMQELIDWAISLQYKQQQCIDWIVIKDKAESLLATEKEQRLEDMILMQCITDVDYDGDVTFMFKPIEYYEHKYGKTFIDLVSDEESKVHEVVRKLKEKR